METGYSSLKMSTEGLDCSPWMDPDRRRAAAIHSAINTELTGKSWAMTLPHLIFYCVGASDHIKGDNSCFLNSDSWKPSDQDVGFPIPESDFWPRQFVVCCLREWSGQEETHSLILMSSLWVFPSRNSFSRFDVCNASSVALVCTSWNKETVRHQWREWKLAKPL